MIHRLVEERTARLRSIGLREALSIDSSTWRRLIKSTVAWEAAALIHSPRPVLASLGALLVVQDAMFFTHRGHLADLAMRNHLPTIYGNLEHVEAGGFMAYTSNRLELFRRAAGYVERILKGARPADLPIQQPTKFELIINAKAGKMIGIDVPPILLARADEVIE